MSDARDQKRREEAEPKADEKKKRGQGTEARAAAKRGASSHEGQRSSDHDAALAYMLTAKGRDRERKRIAQELHDGLLHSLIAAKFAVERLDRRISSDDGRIADALEDVTQQLRDCIEEVRAITWELLPPRLEDVDYIEALHKCIDAFATHHPATIRRRLQDLKEPLTAAQKLNVFRILQEALSNVAKHSEATCVEIELQQVATTLQLRISDNGRGFARGKDVRRGHGLTNMRNRAFALGGSISIQPGRGSGIHVSVEIPLTEG